MKRKNQKLAFVFLFLVIISVIFILLYPGCDQSYSSQLKGEERASLTSAPYVPPPILRNHPSRIIVDLETKEVKKRLADGVEYVFWTFGGNVPGKFIRVKEGDIVEFNLHNNPTSKMPHNIDLHAVTGPGGGATSSFTAPGHTSTFSFKALNSGLYVYHCATAPVGMHIANGMYGLILVEPKEGLPPVDREYYVMQSEFYTQGRYGESGLQPFAQQKAEDENPAYVVFNGSVGALTGDNAIQAKTGETIRLYIGNGGPNLVSSFHVIGEIFDKVFTEGGTRSNHNVQTTLIPAGGSAIVEFKVEVPGTFILVDHSIFRAFNKGAIGMLKVSGNEDLAIYSGKQKDQVYFGSDDEDEDQDLFSGPLNLKSLPEIDNTQHINNEYGLDPIELGKSIYTTTCFACHQLNGEGMPGVFPPLAKSDFLNKNKEVAISAIINGLTGEVTVNGKTYNGIMPPQNLNNKQVAAVLTYVYNQWGNSGKKVSEDEVAEIREKKVISMK
ncbi:MAG: nitrite reductase, copper-containing [Ignavibacteria bacterium GWB2_36_8]|nr:MAG: nitrite reductase, copper-containing [Ignavibacteria bacterium GWB2_36_8]